MWALGAFDGLIDVGSIELDDRPIGERKHETDAIRAAEPSFQNGLARNRRFVKWLFQTPAWAGEIRIARTLFRRFGIGSAIAFRFVSFGAGAFLHI